MLLHSPEMHIQLVQVLQQGAEGCTFGHLGEGVDILGEALATVAELAVGAEDVGVGVVDVAGEEDAVAFHQGDDVVHVQLVVAGVEAGVFLEVLLVLVGAFDELVQEAFHGLAVFGVVDLRGLLFTVPFGTGVAPDCVYLNIKDYFYQNF